MTLNALTTAQRPRLAMALFLVPMAALALPSAILALDGVHGLVVEKCFSSELMPLVAVIRAEDGSFRLLTSTELHRNGLVYEVVGGSTLVISLEDGRERTELAVHDSPLPLDVLTAALARLAGKQIVLAAPVPAETIDYRPSGGEPLAEVAALWEALGVSFDERDDVVLVGAAEMQEEKANEAEEGNTAARRSSGVTATVLRSPLADFADVLEETLGGRVTVGEGAPTVTVCVDDMASDCLFGHLRRLCGVTIEHGTQVTVAAASRELTTTKRLTAEQGRRVFTQIVALARRHEVARARATLVKLIRHSEPQARYYVALFQLSWKLGDKTRACKAIKLALKLDGTNEYARRVVRKLRAMKAASEA